MIVLMALRRLTLEDVMSRKGSGKRARAGLKVGADSAEAAPLPKKGKGKSGARKAGSAAPFDPIQRDASGNPIGLEDALDRGLAAPGD